MGMGVNITDAVHALQNLTRVSSDAVKQVITLGLKEWNQTTGADLAWLQVVKNGVKKHIKIYANELVNSNSIHGAKELVGGLKNSDHIATAIRVRAYNESLLKKDPGAKELMPIVLDLTPVKKLIEEYKTVVANVPQVIRTAEPSAASEAEPVMSIIAYGGRNAMRDAIKSLLPQISLKNGQPIDVG